MIPTLLSPLFIILLMLILSLLLRLAGRNGTWILGVATAVLFLLATPLVSDRLMLTLESQYPPITLADIQKSDAILLVGGGLNIPLPPRTEPQLGSMSDRIYQAYKMITANIAPVVTVTGGNVYKSDVVSSEAQYTAGLLEEWGIPSDKIIVDDRAKSNRDIARNLLEMAEKRQLKRISVVSSAYHLPRTMMQFEGCSIMIDAIPSNHRVIDSPRPVINEWLPSAAALDQSSRVFYEYLGMLRTLQQGRLCPND